MDFAWFYEVSQKRFTQQVKNGMDSLKSGTAISMPFNTKQPFNHTICMMFLDLPYQGKCNKFHHIKGEVQSKICLEQSCYGLCKPKEVSKTYSIGCEHEHQSTTRTEYMKTDKQKSEKLMGLLPSS